MHINNSWSVHGMIYHGYILEYLNQYNGNGKMSSPVIQITGVRRRFFVSWVLNSFPSDRSVRRMKLL